VLQAISRLSAPNMAMAVSIRSITSAVASASEPKLGFDLGGFRHIDGNAGHSSCPVDA